MTQEKTELSGFDRIGTIVPWPHGEHGADCQPDGSIVIIQSDLELLQRLQRGWRPDEHVDFVLASIAVLTLAHELAHRRGISNERLATRLALLIYVHTAKRLGISASLARKMKHAVRGAWPA